MAAHKNGKKKRRIAATSTELQCWIKEVQQLVQTNDYNLPGTLDKWNQGAWHKISFTSEEYEVLAEVFNWQSVN